MTIFDLLFIVMILGTIGTLVAAVGASFHRRWTFVRLSFGGLVALWGAYLVVGTAIAIMTPQRIQPIGANRCFDEMCFAVSGFQCVPRIESGGHVAQAHGVFYIVDVRVSSKSRRRAQHEAGRKGILIDEIGRVYDVSPEGSQALTTTEDPPIGLDTDLNPGETVSAKLIFDLPADVKRPKFALESSLMFYPPRIIAGDEMHFLHKPTITFLQ